MRIQIRSTLAAAPLGLTLLASAATTANACSSSPPQQPQPPVLVAEPALGEPASEPAPTDGGVVATPQDGADEGQDDPSDDAGGGSIGIIGILRSNPDGGAIGIGSRRSPPPPRVRLGQPSSQGDLPPEVIARIIRQNFGTLRSCYQKGLDKNPKLMGRVSFRFVIEKDGSVRDVKTTSDMPDKDMVRCTEQGIARLTFPPPDPPGIVTVSYPVVFTP